MIANRPPLMAEKPRRSIFIAAMGAPEASSARFKAISSSSVKPGGGAGSRADPPPQMSATTRSSAVRPWVSAPLRRRQTGGVRHRMGCFEHLDPLAGGAVTVTRHDGAGERAGPESFQREGQLRGPLARADHDCPAQRRRGKIRSQSLYRVRRLHGLGKEAGKQEFGLPTRHAQRALKRATNSSEPRASRPRSEPTATMVKPAFR